MANFARTSGYIWWLHRPPMFCKNWNCQINFLQGGKLKTSSFKQVQTLTIIMLTIQSLSAAILRQSSTYDYYDFLTRSGIYSCLCRSKSRCLFCSSPFFLAKDSPVLCVLGFLDWHAVELENLFLHLDTKRLQIF